MTDEKQRKSNPNRLTRAAFKFYVYEVLDGFGSVIYVGKGCRDRMRVSMVERGGESCREVARFFDEFDAYNYEVDRIAQYEGLLNKNSGGWGGLTGAYTRPYIYKPDWKLTKAALDGIAKCIKHYESGYVLILAGLNLYEYALQTLKRFEAEFGREKITDYLARFGIDGARYV
jgi:hypothetical protein